MPNSSQEKLHFGLQISKELRDKLAYVAKKKDRTLTGQIRYTLISSIREFESVHGVITPDKLAHQKTTDSV